MSSEYDSVELQMSLDKVMSWCEDNNMKIK